MNNKDDRKKSALICGAYGLGNSGDEAILEAVIGRLRNLDSDIEITVITRTPKETAKRNNVRTVNFYNYFAIKKIMKSSTLFISGGGSLIQDVTSTRSLLYYLWSIRAAKKCGCKVIMYACGIGPVEKDSNRKLAAKCINECVDEITVRDELSLEELKNLGVNKPNIELSADIALSLFPAEDNIVDNELSKFDIDPQGKYICFVLRSWKTFTDKINVIRDTAENCYNSLGLTPVFLLLNPKNDAEATNVVITGISVPYRIIDEELPTDILMGIIKRMKLMVSVRLHAIVFAASQEVPFVALSYDPKVKAFVHYLGNDCSINLEDINSENLLSMIRKAIQDDNVQRIKDGIKILRENEKKNIAVIAKTFGYSEAATSKDLSKIAFYETDFRVGGIQKSLINILSKIDYSKCEVDVYYYDDEFFFEKPVNKNLKFIKLESSPYSRFIPFKLYKLIKAYDVPAKAYDVAIDFNSYQNECALGCILTPAKKHVMWIHNDMLIKKRNEWKYRILWTFFKGKFDYYNEYVAVSPRIIDSFKTAAKLPDAKVRSIQNYIDSKEIIRKSKEPCDIEVNDDMYNICSVGRLCHQKGFDILLRYFEKASKINNKLRLYIVGEGPDRELLCNLVKELNITDKVIFTGNLSNPFALENKMDGFALCSRYEGQGMVVREAQVLGLELFIAANLDGYNPGTPVCEDMVVAMSGAKKKSKEYNELEDYNQEITKELEDLFFSE